MLTISKKNYKNSNKNIFFVTNFTSWKHRCCYSLSKEKISCNLSSYIVWYLIMDKLFIFISWMFRLRYYIILIICLNKTLCEFNNLENKIWHWNLIRKDIYTFDYTTLVDNIIQKNLWHEFNYVYRKSKTSFWKITLVSTWFASLNF